MYNLLETKKYAGMEQGRQSRVAEACTGNKYKRKTDLIQDAASSGKPAVTEPDTKGNLQRKLDSQGD